MKPILSLLLLALTPLMAFSQNVKLPSEIRGGVGTFIEVPAETKETYVSWLALDTGLNLFPTRLLKDTRTAVVTASVAGRYRIACVTAKGDSPSEFAIATIVVGDAPPVPPGPGPNPPDPKPPGPVPAPISLDGFRVLIVYDPATLKPEQEAIVFGKECRDYMTAKAVVGLDGKTKDNWIITTGSDVSAAPKWIGDAIQRRPGRKTFMLVSDGKTGYDGDIPADGPSAMAIMKKVGG